VGYRGALPLLVHHMWTAHVITPGHLQAQLGGARWLVLVSAVLLSQRNNGICSLLLLELGAPYGVKG